jgi:hypothetical protein
MTAPPAGTYIPREKILAGGAAGSSKTFSFLMIVRSLAKGHHFAIEVDDGFSKLLQKEFPQIPATVYERQGDKWVARFTQGSGDNLVVYHCQNFGQVRAAQKELEKLITAGTMGFGDWVCIDGIDLMYNNMRYEFIQRAVPAKTERRNNMATVEDAWAAALEIKTKGAPLLDPGDWDTINNFYEGLLNYAAFQIPCNLYCTTGITTFDEKSDFQNDDVKEFYKSLGAPFKFEGQKRTVRTFDTLLLFKYDTTGYWVSIWKDRGGLGRAWSKQERHNSMSSYRNTDFYQKVGVELLGWPEAQAVA